MRRGGTHPSDVRFPAALAHRPWSTDRRRAGLCHWCRPSRSCCCSIRSRPCSCCRSNCPRHCRPSRSCCCSIRSRPRSCYRSSCPRRCRPSRSCCCWTRSRPYSCYRSSCPYLPPDPLMLLVEPEAAVLPVEPLVPLPLLLPLEPPDDPPLEPELPPPPAAHTGHAASEIAHTPASRHPRTVCRISPSFPGSIETAPDGRSNSRGVASGDEDCA